MSSPLLMAYFLLRAARFRLRQTRPVDAPSVKVVGADPLRVLVTGAGIATGYGVERHGDGLAGPLAERLAERLHRGVVVEVRAAPVLPLSRAIAHLGLNGAHTFDAAVFSPCFLEGQLPPTSAWWRGLSAVVAHLQSTGGPRLTVVLMGVPRPSGTGPIDRAAAAAADSMNHAVEVLAAKRERVRSVAVPPIGSVHDARPFDAGYYREAAELLTEELVVGLQRRAPQR